MAQIVEKRSVDRVPVQERTTGFLPLFMLWVGFSISVARIWQGGVITACGFWMAVLALIVGQLCWMYIVAGAVMGASEGLPGTMIMRAAFGIRGRVIPSIPLIIGTIGWFGLQLGITVSAVNMIVKALYGEVAIPLTIQYNFFGFIMGILSIYGYRVVMWFQKFVSPLLLLLIPWMLYKMISEHDILLELTRPRPKTMGFFEAVTILAGGQLAMLITAADSSRYAISRRTAFTSYMSATWFVGTVMFIIGMMGTVIVGTADPAGIVDRLGLGVTGILIVILSAWSTNCMNPYWGGIALSTLTTGAKWFPNGIPRVISTSVVVGIGTLTTIFGIYTVGGFMKFINILAGTLGPVNGIIIVDYFFLRGSGTDRIKTDELMKPGGSYWYMRGWNPIAVAVWVVGIVYSTVFKTTYVLVTPISTQILSGVLYYMLMTTVGSKLLARSR